MPGGRPRQYSDEEFIEAVEELGPVGSVPVSEHVGCTPENARLRLLNLHEDGAIGRTEVKGGHVWYIE